MHNGLWITIMFSIGLPLFIVGNICLIILAPYFGFGAFVAIVAALGVWKGHPAGGTRIGGRTDDPNQIITSGRVGRIRRLRVTWAMISYNFLRLMESIVWKA